MLTNTLTEGYDISYSTIAVNSSVAEFRWTFLYKNQWLIRENSRRDIMIFKKIKYFQIVCAKGNISAAADELYVSRSVISRMISELEKEFQTQLFIRSKNGVVLTEGGRILARFFEEYINTYDITKKSIGMLHTDQNIGTLRLGVTSTNACNVYKKFLCGFLNDYPHIKILTSEHCAADASKYLLNGTVEGFFTPACINEYNVFDMLELYNTQIALIVPANSPLSEKSTIGISGILDLPLGYLNSPMPIESILESGFGAFGKIPNVIIRTSDCQLLLELTLKGYISSILPADIVLDWSGITAIPLDFFPVSTHRLIWNKALPHNKAFDLFLEYMRECTRTEESELLPDKPRG